MYVWDRFWTLKKCGWGRSEIFTPPAYWGVPPFEETVPAPFPPRNARQASAWSTARPSSTPPPAWRRGPKSSAYAQGDAPTGERHHTRGKLSPMEMRLRDFGPWRSGDLGPRTRRSTRGAGTPGISGGSGGLWIPCRVGQHGGGLLLEAPGAGIPPPSDRHRFAEPALDEAFHACR